MGALERRLLIVSIHDVTPSQEANVRTLLSALDTMAVHPRVLKVIPHEHGNLTAYPSFVGLLQQEAAAGAEIVLHGYAHRAEGLPRGFDLSALRAWLFARQAVEFLTLDQAEMLVRLQAGQRELRELGLEPRGFCAPGWLASPHLLPLLRRSGFHHLISMLSVQDVTSGRRILTPWQGYMGAGPGQERLVHLGSWACMTCLPGARVLKVFFHPQGASHSPACARILESLGHLRRTHRLVTYDELFAYDH